MNLANIVASHPADATALRTLERTVSYGELRDDVARLRGGLRRAGVRPGDRVALVAPTTITTIEAYLAIVGAGAVAVPLNPESPAAELGRELAVVRPSLVLSSDGANGSTPIASLEGAGPGPIVDREPSDLAVLLFTAGTAGTPRAAMLTHGCLQANLDQLLALEQRVLPTDVVFGVLPIFHVFGLGVAIGVTLASGATLVVSERFDAAGALAAIAATGVTIVPGAPPMWVAWARLPELDRSSFATVRYALSGAAPLPDEVAAALEDRCGVVVCEGYGLTEASPVVTTSLGIEPRRGSVGKVLDGVEVRLVDSDGDDALDGDPGEIWLRGPNVFAGYWEDPAATDRVLMPDGWLRTGDVAVTDDDGYVYLVDRAKDLVIVSGFNVFPAEVEEVLAAYPGVAEAAVVGVPDRDTGEALAAYVVPADTAHLEEAALLAHCREHLARYKCPARLEIVSELPKGMTGKVLRRLLG